MEADAYFIGMRTATPAKLRQRLAGAPLSVRHQASVCFKPSSSATIGA
jgi:hypothetical protein